MTICIYFIDTVDGNTTSKGVHRSVAKQLHYPIPTSFEFNKR
ncbi:hypothetical protein [Hahella sp. CCB-MM4]|nr:hypothetical protein [Hahella sp. CCB-MM4]